MLNKIAKRRKGIFIGHFVVLIIVVSNDVSQNITNFGFTSCLELFLKILTACSGLILFFLYLKPFKKVNIYFSIYAVSTLLLVIGFIFRGIFWALVMSVILHPIYPDQLAFRKDNLIVYNNYQGFMSRCCSYKVKEQKLLIFEKDYGFFETDGVIDFKTFLIEASKNEIKVSYSTNFHNKLKTIRIIK